MSRVFDKLISVLLWEKQHPHNPSLSMRLSAKDIDELLSENLVVVSQKEPFLYMLIPESRYGHYSGGICVFENVPSGTFDRIAVGSFDDQLPLDFKFSKSTEDTVLSISADGKNIYFTALSLKALSVFQNEKQAIRLYSCSLAPSSNGLKLEINKDQEPS